MKFLVVLMAFGVVWGQGEDAGRGSYVLGADDQIVIRALEAEEISDKPVLIGANGNITLPMIGRIQAAGLTVEELEGEIVARLKKFIQDPQVTVQVMEFRSRPVSVLGSVQTPGVHQLRGRRTLFEILSMAGGLRNDAGSTVRITRRMDYGRVPLPNAVDDPTGLYSIAELPLMDILEAKNPAANIEILPYDTVLVAPAAQQMLYVVGDVQRAGAFTYGEQQRISVLSALSMAGGLGRTAKADKARVLRGVEGSEKRVEIAVNLKRMMQGVDEDLLMKPDDVLVVPSSARRTFTQVLLPATVAAAVAALIYAGVR
jgi:polysaccharide export outer membrane protein